MMLQPLSSDLQRKVIKMQMEGNAFFDHLMALIPVRQEQPATAGQQEADALFFTKLVETQAYRYFLKLNQAGADELKELLARVLLFLVEATGEPVRPCTTGGVPHQFSTHASVSVHFCTHA
eukprot:1655477-Prymnesium_polylepis.1